MEHSKRVEIAKKLDVIFETLEDFYARNLVMSAMLQAAGILDVEATVEKKMKEPDIQRALGEIQKRHQAIRKFVLSTLQNEGVESPLPDRKVQ